MFGLKNHLENIPGYRTTRRVVVFESDDWGSIRMPSGKVYDYLLKAGIPVDRCPYNRYDTLASDEDLEALFEVLNSVRDSAGNPAVITANTLVANPSFEKIRESGFKEYYCEPFTETLKRYPNCVNSFKLWQEGINQGIFVPQFHGREHLNVKVWLNYLQNNHPYFIEGFNLGLWGFGSAIIPDSRINIQAALDAESHTEINIHKEIVADGLNRFKAIFNQESLTFIACNYTWDSEIHGVLHDKGIRGIQGMRYQRQPRFHKNRLRLHFTGSKNELGQIYLVRNCFFEPSLSFRNSVESCMHQIQTAFFWNKLAIVGTHRLNFIGSIVPENRKKNLKEFARLLNSILKRWPDVQFMSSKQLIEMMASD